MRKYRKILRNRKARIERRLDSRKRWSDQPKPMLSASNIHYEISSRSEAITCGGIGAIQFEFDELALTDVVDAIKTQTLKGVVNGFALRVKNTVLQGDMNTCFHEKLL